MKLAVLGLGNMGAALAANLIRKGHDVTVWNRSPGKADALAAAGARAAATPREAVAECDAALTMLADDKAFDAVMAGDDGLLAGLPQGAAHLSHSTIAVATADRAAAAHAERGQAFVSAPVFGRPHVAEAGGLSIVAAGADDAVERLRPLLGEIGAKLFVVGENPSAANLVKLAGNFLLLSTVEAMGEAMALADKGGVAPARMLEVITGTLFDSPLYRVYGPLVVERKFQPAGFAAPLGLKDMRLAGEAAEALRVPMPLLGILRDHLLEAIERHGEDADVAAMAVRR